jgi:hypothetical protein
MPFRIPLPTPESPKRPSNDGPKTSSREFAIKRADGSLHDAGLHAEMLGADDTRIRWIKPAGPIRIPR